MQPSCRRDDGERNTGQSRVKKAEKRLKQTGSG
jgi:hypothetical protein